MKILLIGGGGREHALAWKLAQSERVTEIIVAPGNGGTGSTPTKISNCPPISGELVDFARTSEIDLTIVGPETPLAAGIVDTFQGQGLKIWGPSRAAAQIEASKAFAKAFMKRHNIPTGEYTVFTDFAAAKQYVLAQLKPVVIKASGLAAGKGVILPESSQQAVDALHDVMVNKIFGPAGDEVVIEERLAGPEVSVLAFCDGRNLRPMPPAQDHKRVYDNDTGPNTGGMGAYAPAPVCPPSLLQEITHTILQPAMDGLRAEGRPYVGVLYAGLMLTATGPQVIEFNCRFGDPETQVILPLLETDLLDIVEHSLAGTLLEVDIVWKSGVAATVVLASGGYPGHYETGKPIAGLTEAGALSGVTVFHAGTRSNESGQIVTAGGRVFNITGLGSDLAQALQRAYAGVGLLKFEDMHYRTDIGAKVAVMGG